jgi:hypothetical protein
VPRGFSTSGDNCDKASKEGTRQVRSCLTKEHHANRTGVVGLSIQTLPATKRERFNLHPEPKLLKALKATLLTPFDYAPFGSAQGRQFRPTLKTEAGKLAQQVFRRVL